MDQTRIREWLRDKLSEQLDSGPAGIQPNIPFKTMGLDSVAAIGLAADLGLKLGRIFPPTLLWEYPTIDSLSRFLAFGQSSPHAVASGPGAASEPIALVGIGLRFPGADGPAEFWDLLCRGVDMVRPCPASRIGAAPNIHGGFLDQVDGFDPTFFRISIGEAREIDPNQRLILELSWEALEDAGVAPYALCDSPTGVYMGCMWNDYARIAGGTKSQINQHTAAGQDPSIIAARVSYFLGLRGPSLTISTACSSSLVAVHLACQALLAGECDLALAGGVNLLLHEHTQLAMERLGVLSASARCKAFDAAADGYVRGEGGAVVVLKRYSAAIEQRDRIYCVIRGSAVNNDGRSNGLTSPNPKAQEEVLRAACARAGTRPELIQYIEAHGTGTPVGDPVEAAALGAVFRAARRKLAPIPIGSVKTNIGHLEAAAGIAGLIKTALAIHNGAIPPSLHFGRPNPKIPFEASKLRVPVKVEAWPEGDRLAGISSFGFGGVNCHMIVDRASEALGAEQKMAFGFSGDENTLPGNWKPYVEDLVFRREFDQCAQVFQTLTGDTLEPCSEGTPGFAPVLLFAFQTALASLLTSLGAEPDAVIGCDAGEVAAAHFAGALTLEDAIRVALCRSRLRAHNAGSGDSDSEQLLSYLEPVRPRRPRIMIVSSVTGAAIDWADLDAAYWWRNLCQPLPFMPSIEGLARSGHTVYVEIGPHPILEREIAAEVMPEVLPVGTARGNDTSLSEVSRCIRRLDARSLTKRDELFPLSAHTSEALHELCTLFEHWNWGPPLHQICHTACRRRTHHDYRLALVTKSREEALRKIGCFLRSETAPGAPENRVCSPEGKLAIVTPPGTSISPAGARELRFRDEVFEAKRENLQHAWIAVLQSLGVPAEVAPYDRSVDAVGEWIHSTGCDVCVVVGDAPEFLDALRNRCKAVLLVVGCSDDGRRELLEIAAHLYELGFDLDWSRFYPDVHRPVRFPRYPFQRQRTWTGANEDSGFAVKVTENRPLLDYYRALAVNRSSEFLRFGVLEQPQAGFSWLRAWADPEGHPNDQRLMAHALETLRETLIGHIDFNAVRRVADVGCGYASDLLRLAREHAHLELYGINLSTEQLDIAATRVRDARVENRIRLIQADLTKDELPSDLDLVLGFQVLHHIRNKPAAIAQIAKALRQGGIAILAEIVANLASPIDDDSSSAHFAPRETWADILADNSIRVSICSDLSRAVANFLSDEDFEANLGRLQKRFDETAIAHLRGPTALGKLLRSGSSAYLVLTLQKEGFLSREAIQRINREALSVGLPVAKAYLTLAELERLVQREIAAVLGRLAEEMDRTRPLGEMGLDSMLMLESRRRLETLVGIPVSVTLFYNYPTIEALSAKLWRCLGFANGNAEPREEVSAIAEPQPL